ncbi:MAG: pilus assembly protein [Pirellulaceae bacterium]|jgi:hypothetical protein|nr:pilus assembly protein [Pirellulaceae bacterium]MDP7015086.1 pilus assembly protein [Pirellulaceae bacterium]
MSKTSQDTSTRELTANAGTLRAPCRKLDKLCRSFRKQRRGASAVEFAVVAPVFFLLVFGMVGW